MQKFIQYFTSIRAADIGAVGGKGANLGELSAAGFNVPDGFCVTTSAYDAFILPKQVELFALLNGLDVENLENLRRAGEKARQMLGKLPLPEELHQPLINAWQKTGVENAYAVRSSATAEDLPQASFAGQQDTYLNIIGKQDLLKSVKDCFISLFTDRAILYRVQNNFEHQQVQLSVVVQKMILPEASGIMFTADPVSGRRQTISIDASFGIGEALVSGLVSADLYQVEASDFSIMKKQFGDKKIAIIPIEGGGTRTVDLDENQSKKATLDDQQIVELAKIGAKIQAHYDKPQDIEWAYVDDQFYITQSRPITSLYPIPDPDRSADKCYISLNHFQVMTDAMPPLSMELFKSILPIGRDEKTGQTKFVLPAGGRLYGEISNILSHPVTGKLFPKIVDRADHLVGKMITSWMENRKGPLPKTKLSLLKLLPVILPVAWRAGKNLCWNKFNNFPLQMSDYMDQHVKKTRIKIDGTDDIGEKLEICTGELRHLFPTVSPWLSHLVASMLAMKLLHISMENRVEASQLDALMRGLEGNVTTEMDLAVGDLADAARSSEALIANLCAPQTDMSTKLQQAENLTEGAPFVAAWNGFLETYGARGPSEIDLYRPRWREDLSSLMTMVAGMLKSGEKGAHRQHYQALIDANQVASETIVSAAGGGVFGFIRKPMVKRLVYVIRQLFPLREHHKFLLIRVLDLSKPVVESADDYLRQTGVTKEKDDVWFLELQELKDCLKHKQAFDPLVIEERRQQFDHYKRLTPPRVITGDGEVLSAQYDTSNAPAGALVGSPVSAGSVEGIAKVILDPAKEVLHPGEILIAPFTDPGWTPLFVNAAGLVTEVGGLMTHGSVIAREYGIPAVVSVKDVTKLIKTGQYVRVNGEAGYIEILDDQERANS